MGLDKILYWVSTKHNRGNWFVIADTLYDAEKFHEKVEIVNLGETRARYVKAVSKALLDKHGVQDKADTPWWRWPSKELLIDLGAEIVSDTPNRRIVKLDKTIYTEGEASKEII